MLGAVIVNLFILRGGGIFIVPAAVRHRRRRRLE
jgi:hypothetical protein